MSDPQVAPTLPSSVRVVGGPGGLSRVVVTSAAATAEVHLQGAHVTSWAPAGSAPVIWMSERSAFAPGVPLRGGVPLCFPWFAKSAAMGDFGDDEWTSMVCVETCNALDGAVTLAPGESHTTTATIAVAPLA